MINMAILSSLRNIFSLPHTSRQAFECDQSEGHAWPDMAILCRHHSELGMCAECPRKRKLLHPLRRNSSSVFDPAHDSIQVMTLHVRKGLAFPVVALVGAGRMPAEGEDEREEARLFYVGATRATQRLVIGVRGNGKFAARLWEKGKPQLCCLTLLPCHLRMGLTCVCVVATM